MGFEEEYKKEMEKVNPEDEESIRKRYLDKDTPEMGEIKKLQDQVFMVNTKLNEILIEIKRLKNDK